MAASIREGILTALATLLSSTSGITGVFRSRTEAVARAEGMVILLQPSPNDIPQIEGSANGVINWQLRVKVTIIARGEIPDKVADASGVSLFNKIMTSGNLGGLALDIMPAPVDFQFVDGDAGIGAISHSFIIWYRTSYTDISI